jgi:RNA polymerase sigma factor for flagellar operon FliA
LYYKEELTMKEISQVVGIVVSRVSQIHAAAMVKLRASLGHLRDRQAEPVRHPRPAYQSANQKQFRESL